jgi:hypothetical protein
VKTGKNQTETNFMSHIPLLDQKHVILALLPFLKHLNAGTLSVILAVALALLNVTHGAESQSKLPSAGDTTTAGAAIDGSFTFPDKLTLPGALEVTCFYSQPRVSLTASEHSKDVLSPSNSNERRQVTGR